MVQPNLDRMVDAYQVSRCPHYVGARWPEPDWDDFDRQFTQFLARRDEYAQRARDAVANLLPLSFDKSAEVWREAIGGVP
jgi:hypothetical protein